ncbi:MAG: ribosome biogenesis GTPase Der [Patescibacteria group bacterium]|jgi:GTP-binding protein
MKHPAVLILGRTNVGKSTLFNRLVGGNFAITHPSEHTTRDLKEELIKWNEKIFTLIDSGGFDLFEKNDLSQAVIHQIEKALAKAEIVVLVIDGISGWHQQENQILNKLLSEKKKLVLAVNKLDAPDLRKGQKLIHKFQRAALTPILVSAKNGGGSGDLLDAIAGLLGQAEENSTNTRSLKIAIIGKTNVGKSALTNALVGEEVRVVSELPHTTRDAAEFAINYQDQSITLIDTAGVRTRGRTADQIEALSLKATLASLEKADIAMLVWRIDDKIGLVEKTLANKAAESGKGLLLVANQTDRLASREQIALKILEKECRRTLNFVDWAPLVSVSAVKKMNLKNILTSLVQIKTELNRQIGPDGLRSICRQAINSLNLNFILRKKIKAKLLQINSPIPIFELHINLRTALPVAVARITEKKLRENFGFSGVPIKVKLLQPYAKTI